MSHPTPDECPRCGEWLHPVLVREPHRPGPGPLCADPQVQMACTACPTVEAPSLSAR